MPSKWNGLRGGGLRYWSGMTKANPSKKAALTLKYVQGNTTLNFQPAVLIKVESSAAPEAGSGDLLGSDGDIVRGSGGRR